MCTPALSCKPSNKHSTFYECTLILYSLEKELTFGAEVEQIWTQVLVNMNVNASGSVDGPFGDLVLLRTEQDVQAILYTQLQSANMRLNERFSAPTVSILSYLDLKIFGVHKFSSSGGLITNTFVNGFELCQQFGKL